LKKLIIPLFLFAATLQAQEILQPVQNVSMFRFGTMIGRDGAAFGPGVLVEFNPISRLGVYGFAGQSSINGYQAGDGIVANFTDRTLGFGIVYRAFHIGRFTIGGFTQAAYYGDHVRASYPDGSGGTIEYRDSSKDPLVTIGPDVEIKIVGGISAFVRPGEDLGQSIAAQTVHGFSINGGVVVGAPAVVKGFKSFGKLFR
jgi:hypothetical protein